MTAENVSTQYFHEYFAEWMGIYKLGAVRPVTYRKYVMTSRRLAELAPDLRVCELDKRSYQTIINDYARTHEKQTTLDFHHHLKSAIMDAIDEGMLASDPTRKVIIKGKPPVGEKAKYLSLFELRALLGQLSFADEPDWDWFILLVAKTGLRFSEALALSPQDFDFTRHKIRIVRTWDYKSAAGGFSGTKNPSSTRTISIDPVLSGQFLNLSRDRAEDKLLFVEGRVFNAAVNKRLRALCIKAGVPEISLHCLRHTHASMLIFAGVSIASIAKRLGHSNVTTTQETYLHIIRELESRDNDTIIMHLSALI